MEAITEEPSVEMLKTRFDRATGQFCDSLCLEDGESKRLSANFESIKKQMLDDLDSEQKVGTAKYNYALEIITALEELNSSFLAHPALEGGGPEIMRKIQRIKDIAQKNPFQKPSSDLGWGYHFLGAILGALAGAMVGALVTFAAPYLWIASIGACMAPEAITRGMGLTKALGTFFMLNLGCYIHDDFVFDAHKPMNFSFQSRLDLLLYGAIAGAVFGAFCGWFSAPYCFSSAYQNNAFFKHKELADTICVSVDQISSSYKKIANGVALPRGAV